MRRKAIIVLLSLAGLIVAAGVAWPRISYYNLTGRFFPIHKIESLQHPIAVKGWTLDGLLLADGRTIQLPGFRELPKESVALTEATKRGIELSPDGRVFGLMRIHHWCGNDPVREHIARVDLSSVMMFLRVGQTSAPVPESDSTVLDAGGRFSEWGWNVSEYFQFQGWEKIEKSTP